MQDRLGKLERAGEALEVDGCGSEGIDSKFPSQRTSSNSKFVRAIELRNSKILLLFVVDPIFLYLRLVAFVISSIALAIASTILE